MPDAKRKLPVVYADIESLNDLQRSGQADVWCITATIQREFPEFVRYIPDIPRCRTCSFYEPRPGYDSVCNEQCPGYEDRRKVPSDGSGFCHAHEPRKSE